MTFRYPWILLLLLLVPVLAWLRGATWRRPTLRFSDGATLRRLPESWAARASRFLPILYGFGLAFLVLALARPQRGLAESRVRTDAVDIVLVVDVSTSMRALDFSTALKRMDRLDAVKEVLSQFIRARPNDRMGLVAFAAMPYTSAPLTLDHGWLLQQVERLQTGMIEDGTAIGDAIASGVNRLRESRARSKLVVLLTDGLNNRGHMSPDNAAQAAKALGIRVYTVGAGSSGLVEIPVQDPFGGTHLVRQRMEMDEEGLKRIATTTGAEFFRARDFNSLQKVYSQIDRLERTEIDVEQYTQFEERFPFFLLFAMFALGAEKLLAMTRLGRLP